MCGIAGIVAPDARQRSGALLRMMDVLVHRGPDAQGRSEFDNCLLGHRRLSIVDLSTGDQPMRSGSQNHTIVFNGEIYGYKELREEEPDFSFNTQSDTEVILALYARYGAGCARRLPGMFAFAIWDETEQILYAARDRFGEKPLYYAWGNKGEFLFASEIKSLIASGLIDPVMSRTSLCHYLKRLYVHPTRTIYSNIHTLPPAHQLVLRNGFLTVERYWQLPANVENLTMEDAVPELQRLLERSVSRQLIADVPVGAFLSGGLDSTTIVAAASRKSKRLQTIAFGFGGETDELPYAREVAQRYETDHLEVTAAKEDIGDLLIEMQRVYDEPFADSSNIPTFLISRLARRHLKVVLTGDGGDELFGGYREWYLPLFWMTCYQNDSLPKIWLRRVLLRLLGLGKLPRRDKWRKLDEGLSMRSHYSSVAEAHESQNVFYKETDLRQIGLLTEEQKGTSQTAEPSTHTVSDAMRMDIADYLPGDILVKTDRASMAHGLELRAPFLDVDLASFCIGLPSNLKVHSDTDKKIMRMAFSDWWPDSIQQRGKQGFGARVSDWFRIPNVEALLKLHLDNPKRRIFELLSFKHTRGFVAERHFRTWALLVLSLWLESHDCELDEE